STTLTSVRVPGFAVSVNVQTVSSPGRMLRLSTPVDVGVPVAVPAAFLTTHECAPSSQADGTASFRSSVVVGRDGISIWDPLPLIVQLAGPSVDADEALNTNGVPRSGFATFTIVRNPAPGVTMQSEGAEPGPDG